MSFSKAHKKGEINIDSIELDIEEPKSIDWSQIRDLDDIAKLGKHNLYDYTDTESAGGQIELNEYLSPAERKDALFWQPVLHGLIVITSNPGQGKSLLQYTLAHKSRRYYNRIPVIDHKPRELFGLYVPFSEPMFKSQLDRMLEMVQVDNDYLSQSTSKLWQSPKGQVFLHNSTMVLEDFQRYMPRNNPNLPVARAFGDLFTIWRHLGVCILASATKIRDLNRLRCYPEIRYHVYCERHPAHKKSRKYKDVFLYWFKPIKWNENLGIFERNGETIKVFINGAQPRLELDGGCYYDLYNSWNVPGIQAPKSMKG